jgi:trimeric autotransporter adhesin
VSDIPDLPMTNHPQFLQRVRQVLHAFLGKNGGDRVVTFDELASAGLVSTSGGSTVAGPALEGEPDLTPPPTPTGLTVTAGITRLIIQWDEPTYTAGHGHDRTVIYGATYGGSGPLPTFSNAVEIKNALGIVTDHTTPTGTQWHIWIKWKSKDGVLSINPAGGANGVQATTGKIGTADLNDLIITSQKIASGAVDAFAKFAGGLEPISSVAALPAVGGYTGPKTVFLTTDNKLYRFTGAAWTTVVPTTDLTGQITTTQITDSAITTPKINTGAVTANELAANSVTAGKIQAAAVVAGKIAANAIVAGDGAIANAAITNALIANAAIDSAKIADAAIVTAKIADANITSAKIGNAQITNAHINDLSAVKINAGTLDAARIAAGTITGSHIAATTITGSNIAANTITTGKIIVGEVSVASASSIELSSQVLNSAVTSQTFDIPTTALSITTTGAPVKIMATIKAVQTTSGSATPTVATLQGTLLIDGSLAGLGTTGTSPFCTVPGPALQTITSISFSERYTTLAAGTHTIKVRATVGWFNGATIVFGTNASVVFSVTLVAEENKV